MINQCEVQKFCIFHTLSPIIAGCDEAELLTWNKTSHCFTHTWDTVPKRQWLWNTCKVYGREITVIFFSGIDHILHSAYQTKDCDSMDVQMIRQLIAEGHIQVRFMYT